MLVWCCELCQDVYVSPWPLDPCPTCGGPGGHTHAIEADGPPICCPAS